MDQEKQSENISKYSSELPQGITIADLRKSVPASSQLIVRFEPLDTTDPKKKGVSFTREKRTEQITYNLNYVVGLNEKGDEVYLNPLVHTDGVPEESNISLALDFFLARKDVRKKAGLRIIVESPDFDLPKEITQRKEILAWKEIVDEFKGELEASEAQILEQTKTAIAESELSKLETGERYSEVLLMACYLYAEETYYLRKIKGETINIQEVYAQVVGRAIEKIITVTKTRIPELKNLTHDPNSFAMAIDKVDFDLIKDFEGLSLLSFYFPDKGWSIISPIGACPSQADAMIDNLFSGKVDPKEFPEFTSSFEDLVRQGKIVLDHSRTTLIFKGVDTLRGGIAVFHGDDPITYALETLKTAGDPYLGETVFRYILFKDTSESRNLTQEPISININDLEDQQ